MVTEVIKKIANNNSNSTKASSTIKKDEPEVITVPMADNNKETKETFDRSCDGKFSASEALTNFGKGLVSPVTGMFSSPKALVAAGAMMGASALIIAATGGAAAPLFVAAGIAGGVFQLGKAGYKMATAKDGDDVEKAFYDVGGATTTLALSAAGAKASLKQANIEPEGYNFLTATGKCFKASKECAGESFQVFKTGYFKTNLANAFKGIFTPRSIKIAAKELAAEKKHFESTANAVRESLPEEYRPSFECRSKSEASSVGKLMRDRNGILREIKKIKKNSAITDKQTAIDNLLIDKFENVENFASNYLEALKKNHYKIEKFPELLTARLEDLHGGRLNLKTVSAKVFDKLTDNFAEKISDDSIELPEFESYKGYNEKYPMSNQDYFNSDQASKIQMSSISSGKPIRIKNGTKPSGYTCTQIKIKPKNGQIMELQIRGEEMNKAAQAEHFFYDILGGKDISKGNNRIGMITLKAAKAIKKLTPEQLKQYKKYFYDNYMYAQRVELRKPAIQPLLPEGFNPVLSQESLLSLSKQINHLPSGLLKDPFALKPQLGLISSIEIPSEN